MCEYREGQQRSAGILKGQAPGVMMLAVGAPPGQDPRGIGESGGELAARDEIPPLGTATLELPER